MSIERLIESIGLPPSELKQYLLAEIDEFLEATNPDDQEAEFGDVLFALTAMAWAKTGRHPRLDRANVEQKLRQRLRTHASLTRYAPIYHDDRIPDLVVGVLHFVGATFGGQWQEFDALRNGTVAEIQMLTEVPFGRPGSYTNHCIVTFGDTDALEYDFLESSPSMEGGNTIRCRIPDFLFAEAKQQLNFSEFADLLSLQVMAALDGLRVTSDAIAHFHSWENGFLMGSQEVLDHLAPMRTIFSPYLTVSRLQALMEEAGGEDWTMTPEEIAVGAHQERQLGSFCDRLVVESERDREFYAKTVPAARVEVRSFARAGTEAFDSAPPDPSQLRFLAGGRPVREKGFVELCRAFALVRSWAEDHDVTVSLAILCRESRRDKGASYLAELEQVVRAEGLDASVTIEPKVSLPALRRRIAASCAVIAPSLYDPYCLMPAYAVEEGRPAFVSTYAGISENVASREFVFDPLIPADLLRAVRWWHERQPEFSFASAFPSFEGLYLDEVAT